MDTVTGQKLREHVQEVYDAAQGALQQHDVYHGPRGVLRGGAQGIADFAMNVSRSANVPATYSNAALLAQQAAR